MKDSLINFAWFPYGSGQFLLHTTPVAFSNFNLLRPDGRLYAEKVLSYLPKGDVYWDSYSRVPENVSRQRNRSSVSLPDEHPLTYILQQPALAWAWYLLFALGALFLLFRAKRRQRIIPVLPKNENSSYEFISTIANLHFRQKDYRNMCMQQMKLFLAQLRDRYGMLTPLEADGSPRINAEFLERLARFSGVPEKEIQPIFTHYNNCLRYEPTEDMLVELHLDIERFEKAAK
ncbi:MAG: hypothetical protein IPL65_02300 [Lewinellaceae bacterium]|nr:hypothetical protein [Lewinellaceae bacterium]